jgi:hypothetical protein
VPIFPELRPYLDQAFDAAEPGATHIVTVADFEGTALRRRFMRIIRKAGLTPWERVFHNLRASRETELAAIFPLHLVCEWMGNQTAIAAKHYLKATDADFERAAKSGALALHIPVQQDDASSRTKPQESSEVVVGCGPMRDDATCCDSLQDDEIPPRGLELPANSPENPNNPTPCGAKSGALTTETVTMDPTLAKLINAWPNLPEAIRAAIVAIVQASKG